MNRVATSALLVIAMGRLSVAQNKPVEPQSKHPVETFYSQAQRAILRILYIETDAHTKLTTVHSGTAFFVHTPKNWYAVTAAHVVAESVAKSESYMAQTTLSLDNGNSVNVRMIFPSEKWKFHPEGGDNQHSRVDVAAMKIRYLGGELKSFLYCAANCPKNEYNELDTDPEPPDVVLTFGFPIVPGMIPFSRPLGRQGMVAFMDDRTDTIDVENKWFDRKGFVIDSPSIAPGASGSPVIKQPAFGNLTLVGLISASNTNLGAGYAVAEPVSRIKELIDRLEDDKVAVVDPWCLATQDDAKKITNNTIPVCK